MGILIKGTVPGSLAKIQSHNGKGYTLKDEVHYAVDAFDKTPVVVNDDFKGKIARLEAAMQAEVDKGIVDPVAFTYQHYFTPGVYTRQMILPAGTIATGHIHKRSSINIITRGTVRVVTDEGTYEIVAPHTFVSGPGVRKVLHCITEVEWTCSYPWDGKTTDFDELANQYLVSSYDLLEKIEE